MKMFTDNVLPHLSAMKSIVLLSSVIYVAIIIGTNITCVKKLNNGVNVE